MVYIPGKSPITSVIVNMSDISVTFFTVPSSKVSNLFRARSSAVVGISVVVVVGIVVSNVLVVVVS